MGDVINSFSGEYSFLSNFYKCPVTFEGRMYGSSEAAYQASKTLDLEVRKLFENYSPSKSKQEGRKLKVRNDWDEVKLYNMYTIVENKFKSNPELMSKLKDTGNSYIEEGNNWGDTFWGTVNGMGENWLGLILMEVRKTLE